LARNQAERLGFRERGGYNCFVTAVALSAKQSTQSSVRPLNAFRDLPAVADLIEICFASTLDGDGRRYVREMRSAGQTGTVQRWASRLNQTASLPLTGYVWDESGRIVGNASLLPFRSDSAHIYLLANVAVHPDFRGRGIARALTEKALFHAGEKGADSVWLTVRADNEAAIQLYSVLGLLSGDRLGSSGPAAVDEFATSRLTPAACRGSTAWVRGRPSPRTSMARRWTSPCAGSGLGATGSRSGNLQWAPQASGQRQCWHTCRVLWKRRSSPGPIQIPIRDR
jgi:ribosomal protein S18 acetylase RimI-like enzyme